VLTNKQTDAAENIHLTSLCWWIMKLVPVIHVVTFISSSVTYTNRMKK